MEAEMGEAVGRSELGLLRMKVHAVAVYRVLNQRCESSSRP